MKNWIYAITTSLYEKLIKPDDTKYNEYCCLDLDITEFYDHLLNDYHYIYFLLDQIVNRWIKCLLDDDNASYLFGDDIDNVKNLINNNELLKQRLRNCVIHIQHILSECMATVKAPRNENNFEDIINPVALFVTMLVKNISNKRNLTNIVAASATFCFISS